MTRRSTWHVGPVVAALLLACAPGVAAERLAAGQDAAVNAPPARPAPPARRGNLPPPGRRGAAPAAGAPTTAEVEQLFDRYVRSQARIALSLTPDQMAIFAPEFNRLQATRRRVQRERQRLLNQLASASRGGEPGTEDVIAQRVAALDEHRVTAEQQVRDALAAVDQVLTVQQRARFRVFEQRIERQRLELLSRAQRAARGTPPAAAPPASGE